jgi:hypothetical protein
MFARLGECKHPRRLPSMSFGATTEYDRSGQPMNPLTRSRQPDLRKAGELTFAAVCCSAARKPRLPTRAQTTEAARSR